MATYAQEVLADSPAAYYRLNEAAGTSAANLGSVGTAGTYSGTYTLNQARFVLDGASVNFSGASASQVNCNFTTNYTSACTLEAWISPAAGGTAAGYIICKSVYYAIAAADFPISLVYDVASKKVGLTLSNGGDFTADASLLSAALTLGQEYHVVGVYRANGLIELYIDGVQVASTTIAFTINTNTRNWRIGAAQENAGGVGGSAFPGRIAEAAIYSTALSAARIAAHYAARNNAVVTAAAPSTTFGTPQVVPIAVGWSSTVFGAPRLVTTTAQATGGVPETQFGTPRLVPSAVGWRNTNFGIPSTPLPATGWRATQFGTPGASTRYRATSLGRATRWGTPTTPTPRTCQARGAQFVRFGHPIVWCLQAVSNAQHGHAYGLRPGTRFGAPTAI